MKVPVTNRCATIRLPVLLGRREVNDGCAAGQYRHGVHPDALRFCLTNPAAVALHHEQTTPPAHPGILDD
jgi:hypothetical protein